jgi:methyl-accepting chemotaxis protein
MKPGNRHFRFRRRTVLVDRRLQVGTGLAFAALVSVSGAVFAVFFGRAAAGALRAASFQAHYHFLSSYEIVGGLLVRHLAGFFGGALAGVVVLSVFFLRRLRRGLARFEEDFRRSSEGDLSFRAQESHSRETAEVGRKADAFRARTRSRIDDIRKEADLLRKESLPPEVFLERWKSLKRKVAELLP